MVKNKWNVVFAWLSVAISYGWLAIYCFWVDPPQDGGPPSPGDGIALFVFAVIPCCVIWLIGLANGCQAWNKYPGLRRTIWIPIALNGLPVAGLLALCLWLEHAETLRHLF